MVAHELSQLYHCALLSLDQVIIDAIDSQQRSEHAQRAHHMCRDALEKHIEEQRQAEADADHAAPTQTGRKRGRHSAVRRRSIRRDTREETNREEEESCRSGGPQCSSRTSRTATPDESTFDQVQNP